MINRAVESSSLTGIKLSKDCPYLSHLLFADDSLIFMQANTNNRAVMRSILLSYCNALGQMINEGKSYMFLIE